MRDGGHCSLGESRSASSHSVEDVSRPSNAQLSSSRRLSWVQCGSTQFVRKKIATESENRLSLYIF